MKYSDAGKGSAPRKKQDMDAYRNNWDLIFGKKNEDQSQTTETKESTDQRGDSKESG